MGEKPPPTYEETFPERTSPNTSHREDGEGNDDNDLNTVDILNNVKNVDVIPVPIMSQLLSNSNDDDGHQNHQRVKKYMINDLESGKAILQGMEIPSSDINIRGINLTLLNERSVLNLGYLYAATFTTLEFSSPDGTGIGVFQRDGLGVGLLCPCICLCCCCPMATASIKGPNGDNILIGDAYLFPRKVDFFRPRNLGGYKIGSVDVSGLHPNQSVKARIDDSASLNEKLLIIGLAVGMMDYERLHKARGGYGYHSTD